MGIMRATKEITFYGLVTEKENIYKPFIKTESLEAAKEIKGDKYGVAIIKYKGYKRTAYGRETLIIKEIAE